MADSFLDRYREERPVSGGSSASFGDAARLTKFVDVDNFQPAMNIAEVLDVEALPAQNTSEPLALENVSDVPDGAALVHTAEARLDTRPDPVAAAMQQLYLQTLPLDNHYR